MPLLFSRWVSWVALYPQEARDFLALHILVSFALINLDKIDKVWMARAAHLEVFGCRSHPPTSHHHHHHLHHHHHYRIP